MIRKAALPGLATAAALMTAVAVVANPIVPVLPDIQIPALFPVQVDLPPVASHAATGAAAVAVPAITAAVRNVEPAAVAVQQTVSDVATAVVPSPGVSALIHAARALTAGAVPAISAPSAIRTAPQSNSAVLANTQRATPVVVVRSFLPVPGPMPSAAPPPMASVDVVPGAQPEKSAPAVVPQTNRSPAQSAPHHPVVRKARP